MSKSCLVHSESVIDVTYKHKGNLNKILFLNVLPGKKITDGIERVVGVKLLTEKFNKYQSKIINCLFTILHFEFKVTKLIHVQK